jgi:hypothetical protein
MPILFVTGFAGDAAGSPLGRRPNEIVLTISAEGGGEPFLLLDPSNYRVEMVARGAPSMTVTSVWRVPGGLTCGLRLGQVFRRTSTDQPRPSTPPPGVYLFGVYALAYQFGGTTLATAVLDSNLEIVEEDHIPFDPQMLGIV